MSMNLKSLLISLALSLFCGLANAALPSSVSDEEIYQYIDQIGLKDTYKSLTDQIAAMSQQQKLTNPNPEVVDQSTKLVIDTWSPSEAMTITSDYIRANTSEKQFLALREWQNSSLAKTMSNEELQATQASFQADLMHYMAVLQTNPPKQEMVTAIQNLVVSTRMTESTVELVLNIMKSMAQASGQAGLENFEAMEQQMKPMLQAQMKQQMIMTSYYIYRNVSPEQLDEYTAFYQSELGSHELDLSWSAIEESFKPWSKRLGAEMLKQKVANK